MAKKWVKKMKKAEAEGEKPPTEKVAEKAAPKKSPLHDNPRS